jgi:predicted transcriptional regulator
MAYTNVKLSDAQKTALKAAASRLHLSESAAIRHALVTVGFIQPETASKPRGLSLADPSHPINRGKA